jgi:hypothetical protein
VGIVNLFKEYLFIVLVIILIIFVLNIFIPFLNPLVESFIDYIGKIWWALLIGFLIGGFINAFIPREYVYTYLGQKGKIVILNAVLLGFLMSACSHGILAIAMALYKRGASTSATLSFLLAAPWANFVIMLLFFSFFGSNAILIIFGSFIIAIISGLIFQVLERKNIIETGKKMRFKKISILKDARKRIKGYSFSISDLKNMIRNSIDLVRMVLWWVLIGILVASMIAAYVPESIMQIYLGPSLLGLFLTLVLGVVIEVCSEGSSPLAFEIYKKTGAFGNAFVFLNAGVATDYTEIGLVAANIGKKAALWMILVTVPQILILGYLFNIVTV